MATRRQVLQAGGALLVSSLTEATCLRTGVLSWQPRSAYDRAVRAG